MKQPESEPSDIARAYDRWSASYDDDRNVTRDLDATVLRGAPLRLAHRDVLELGCGTGKNTLWLAGHARSLTALDFSAGMLDVARQRVTSPNVRFVTHDVRTRWPLDDGSVDVVVGNLVLEHVERLEPIYAEAARVLRPGGQLYFCELHPFRQLRGGQAHFTEPGTGSTIHVPAFLHSVSDYVNAGLAARLTLAALSEWHDAGISAPSVPRLMSVLFERG